MKRVELEWRKGKLSAAGKAELRRIVTAQRVWRKLNPDEEPVEVRPEGFYYVPKNHGHAPRVYAWMRKTNKKLLVEAVLGAAPNERVTVWRGDDIPF